MKTAVYPGSFDPVTNGHLDIIERSAKLFDKLVVVVGMNTSKTPLFTAEERVEMLREATAHLSNVEVDTFSGLLVDYMEQKQVQVIVKGLRAISDFEAEFQMAGMNRKLNKDVETVFMMTSHEFGYLSSSLVKEIFRLGGPVEGLVPPLIRKRMEEKHREGEKA